MPAALDHNSSLGLPELTKPNAVHSGPLDDFQSARAEVYPNPDASIQPDRALLQSSRQSPIFVGRLPPSRPRFINFTQLMMNRNKNRTQQTELKKVQRKYVFIDKRRGKSSQLNQASISTSGSDWNKRSTSLSSPASPVGRSTTGDSGARKSLVKVKVVEGDSHVLLFDKATPTADLSALDLLYSDITTVEPLIRKRFDMDLSSTTPPPSEANTPTATTLGGNLTSTETAWSGEWNLTETSGLEFNSTEVESTTWSASDDPMVTAGSSSSTNHNEIYETVPVGWSVPPTDPYSVQYRPVNRANSEYVTLGRYTYEPTQPPYPNPVYEPSSTTDTPETEVTTEEPVRHRALPDSSSQPKLKKCQVDIGAICPMATPGQRRSFQCYGSGVISCEENQNSICRLYESGSLSSEQAGPKVASRQTTSPFFQPMAYFFCNRPLRTSECFGSVQCSQLPAKVKTRASTARTEESTESSINGTDTAWEEIESNSSLEQVKPESKLSRVQIGLIGALIAVGSIMFIIVTVIAFIT